MHGAPQLEISQPSPEMQRLYSLHFLKPGTTPGHPYTIKQIDFWSSLAFPLIMKMEGACQSQEFSTINFTIYSWLINRVQSRVRRKGKVGMDLPEVQPKLRFIKSLMHVLYQAPRMPNNLNFQYRQLTNETNYCLDQVGNR